MAAQAPAHPGLAIVDKMYACFAKGDMETLKREVFAADITWNLPGHHPLSGIKHGPDEVIAFFGALMATGIMVDNVHFGSMEEGAPALTQDRVTAHASDDGVVERHTGHGRLKNGEEIIFPTCSYYRIHDGRIAEVQVYTGDQHNVDRYFWAMYDLKPIPDRLG
jgi:hypothetical protein